MTTSLQKTAKQSFSLLVKASSLSPSALTTDQKASSEAFFCCKNSLDYFRALIPRQGSKPERLNHGTQLHLQEHSYVSRSRYPEQLDRYLNLFPEHQMLVLQSETFFANPAITWRRIEAFLGLPSAPCPAGTPKANAGRGEANGVPETIRMQLRQQLRTTALEVRQRYGFGWDWA